MTINELVDAEKAATIVRRIYEDKGAVYNGKGYNDMPSAEKERYVQISQKLSKINSIRIKIINEMEERLMSIKDEQNEEVS